MIRKNLPLVWLGVGIGFMLAGILTLFFPPSAPGRQEIEQQARALGMVYREEVVPLESVRSAPEQQEIEQQARALGMVYQEEVVAPESVQSAPEQQEIEQQARALGMVYREEVVAPESAQSAPEQQGIEQQARALGMVYPEEVAKGGEGQPPALSSPETTTKENEVTPAGRRDILFIPSGYDANKIDQLLGDKCSIPNNQAFLKATKERKVDRKPTAGHHQKLRIRGNLARRSSF